MNLIAIENLEMKYFEKVLYKNVNLEINSGDKIILLGENGKGKSTLLKLITGIETPTKGKITAIEDLKISVLNQFTPINEDLSVQEILDTPFKKVISVAKELEELAIKMGHSEELYEKYLRKNEEFEALGGYDYVLIQDKFIQAFDFTKLLDRHFSTLSGGEKQHMLLAVALFNQGDLIILDEPVTFFDKKKTKWLVEFINESLKTFLIVAHEEDFIKKVSTKIFDIDNREIRSYEASYIKFLHEKEIYLQSMIDENNTIDEKLELKRISIIKKLTWMERAVELHSHAITLRRMEREVEQLENQKYIFDETTQYDYTIKDFEETPYMSQYTSSEVTDIEWIKFKDVSLRINSNLLYEKVNFTFNKNDRIVITGENGAGKSSFLKIITGDIKNTSGEIYVNKDVTMGYISQDVFFENNNVTVFEYCKNISCLGDILLEEYIDKLFDNDENFRLKRLYMLSGGESKRLQILAHILSGVNLLVLDEPTTFMDNYSKNKLMKLLKNFKGGIILITHDLPLIRAITYKRYRIENNRFNKN
ncbi:MAG: ABC-F family ATP-binding cassette domain-containing protein [Lachnospirales bacterium]